MVNACAGIIGAEKRDILIFLAVAYIVVFKFLLLIFLNLLLDIQQFECIYTM